MPKRFTIGIEEEFQLVDHQTGDLVSRFQTILEKGATHFGERIKQELLQSTVEIVTDICPNIFAARKELRDHRKVLTQLAKQEGLALISAGTHPTAKWQEQDITCNDRYIKMVRELRDVARSALIFGLHIHIGVEDKDKAINFINQLRTWLPHLLALSSNSPFSNGRFTGYKSFRSVIWRTLPRSGIPDAIESREEFEHYIQKLVTSYLIEDGKKIWWDIRPHPFFNTVEFRICDMPATIEDTLAIAALCQALVAKLNWLHERQQSTPVLPSKYIEENKWQAMIYGLNGTVFDFENGHQVDMRESIGMLLDFVDDVLDDLDSRYEINYLRKLLKDPRGTGADRQIYVSEQTGSVDAVTHFLMQQTVQGI